ncbi:MAG: DUF2007 domain-containing protein [Bacteroidia bacterium]|nr:DUF2007 domain-containing protein [Bacteroidia bacterium]
MTQNEWIKVYSHHEPHKVEIVKAVLLDNNIESAVIDKRDRSYISIGEMELYVKPGDDVLAQVIIKNNNL